jgi:hypothetical protein
VSLATMTKPMSDKVFLVLSRTYRLSAFLPLSMEYGAFRSPTDTRTDTSGYVLEQLYGPQDDHSMQGGTMRRDD